MTAPGTASHDTNPLVCPACGRSLGPDSPGGNCPTCLLKLAVDSIDGGREGGAGSAPRWFGGYELIEELGRGGMGVVWRARQTSLGREVALKMVLDGGLATEAQVLRFLTEARAAALLDHPHIVPIYEVGEVEGRHFYTMKLIAGRSLAERAGAADGGFAAPEESARIVAAVARAVHHAHQRGILHRDLKPSNILLDAGGAPHVADFGLARIASDDSSLTRSEAVLGSPAYMAPEVASGGARGATTAADIYSLGAVLYELLTGSPPFNAGTPLATLRAVLEEEPSPPRSKSPGVDRDLETICLKGLAKEPARRYASPLELAEDLERRLRGEPILARPSSRMGRLVSWARRRPELAALAVALIAALVAGAIGVLWQWRRAATHARDEALQAYAADLLAASRSLERGELGLARSLLDRHPVDPAHPERSGFELRHLRARARGDELRELRGHVWTVNRVAFSPDGTLLASASMDKTVRIWRCGDGEQLATLPAGGGAAWCVAFTPDGSTLVTSGSDNRVRFFSTVDYKPHEREVPGELIALSPDGRILAAVEASPWYWVGKPGPATLWDWKEGRKVATLGRAGRFAAFAPDGHTLALVGEQPHSVDLFDAREPSHLASLQVSGPPWTLAFSPDSRLLAVAGWDGSAEVWDWRKAERRAALSGHEGIVWSAHFSPDGGTLVTTASDQRVRIWDASSGSLLQSLRGHLNEVWCAAFDREGRRLATGEKGGRVLLWAMPPQPDPSPILAQIMDSPVFGADDASVATTVLRDEELRVVLWDLATHRPAREWPGRRLAGRLTELDPGNKEMFCLLDVDGGAFEHWRTGADAPARRIQIERREVLQRFDECAWASGAGTFLVAERDGQVEALDSATGRATASWRARSRPIRSVSVSHDGRFAVLAPENEHEDNVYGVEVRDLSTGGERLFLGHRDLVEGLAFSPDDTLLATGSLDATIKLWEVASGREVTSLAGHLQDVAALSFSPDGKTLASVGQGRDLKLWHLPTGREVASFALRGARRPMAFSPDGRWLAVSTEEGELALFEAPAGALER